MGGLGIIDTIWNKRAYCGVIFKLLTYHKSICVQWNKEYSLKRKKNWTIEIPADCSWAFWGVLKYRKEVGKLIRYYLANREDKLLWYYIWCGDSLLLEDTTTFQVLELHKDAKVSSLILERRWNNLVLNLPECDLKIIIMGTAINELLCKDEMVCLPTPSGMFTSKSSYESLGKPSGRLKW